MRGVRAIFCILVGLSLAALDIPQQAFAQAAGGNIVVAQEKSGPGGFFRRLFGGQRRQQQQRQQRGPFKLFPDFDAPEPQAQPRRERKARTAAPQPREPPAVEKAADAKRALVIGDFMANALAKGLTDAYRQNANVVVVDVTNGSSGLVRDDYYNWPAKVPELVAEHKPDAILVMMGANDRQTMQTAAGGQAFGSDQWRAGYTARVAALADALKATGKPVLWGGLVSVSSSAMSRDYSSFNGIVREQLEAKGLKFVDMWNGFADEDGRYKASGPDVRGQSVQLRADDGLNFTRAGQRKLAYFVEQHLNERFGSATPILAAVRPQMTPGAPAAAAPLIGPMVPFDALGQMGGDTLSGGVPEDQRGKVATSIAEQASKEDADAPPPARVDSYIWPPPPAAASSSLVGTLPARGPR
jgi:hypothetical protein